MDTKAGKKKILYVEIIRIAAILFVIFNHTKQQGFVMFTLCEKGSFPYWFNMFFSVITGIGVPLFFMISGMLLLGREETIGYVWKKRILKIAVILFVFSLIIRKLFEDRKMPAKLEKVIVNMGSCVFGIYLIEDIFREGFYFIYEAMRAGITGFIAIRIYVVFIFLVCWLVVALFRLVLGLLYRLKG